MEEVFGHFAALWETFGWWSVALAAAVFAVMLPINALVRKVFAALTARKPRTEVQTHSTERTRKTISGLLVYGAAAGVTALAGFCQGRPPIAERVLSGALLLAPAAMAIRAVYKLVRDKGVAPVAASLANSRAVKKSFAELPLDGRIKALLTETVENWLAAGGGDAETALLEDLTQKLTGFTPDALQTARAVVSAVKRLLPEDG